VEEELTPSSLDKALSYASPPGPCLILGHTFLTTMSCNQGKV